MRVAIILPYCSHYRLPIYNLLCRQNIPEPIYYFFADVEVKEKIKLIEFSKSEIDPDQGGLRWCKINNIWLGRILLWQSSAISIAFKKKFDCIIFIGSMYYLSTWFATILARFRGKRVLMWTHGYLRDERNLKGWIRERFYRLADGLLLYGHRARGILINRGYDPGKLYVVYNSLDYSSQCKVRETITQENLNELKKELFVINSFPVLIFIGRLTPQKKLSQLLEAVIYLKIGGVLVNVLLVGDGPEMSILKKFTLEHEIADQVVFYGSSYNEAEIGPLIMLADICVAPGEIGLTCMHALAYGTPVITHDNPDFQMPEWEAITPGITGDLFKHGNSEDLARVISRWLSNGISRDIIFNNCLKIIENYYNPTCQLKVINGAVNGVCSSEIHL